MPRSWFRFWHVLCGEHSEADTDHPGELFDKSPRIPEIHDRSGRDRGCRAVRHFVRQGAVARRDAFDRLRKRAEQHRHPRRRHQRAGLRGVVELLRPAHQPRNENRSERRALLRPRQVQDGTRRRHECRRHVRDVQTEEGRDLPGRHAGHRQGREMVARPRRQRRRLPDLPDGRGLADQARAIRGRRRQHLPRRFRAQGSADDSRSRGDRAGDLQFRTGQEERDREGSLGSRIYQAEHGRQRRLQGDELDRGLGSHPRAQRQLEGRSASQGQAHRLAHGAVRRQPPRACWSAATPISPTTCRTRISSN